MQHYRSEVLPVLRGVAGFEGARLLRRTTGDETAVVADDAREVLVRFDDHIAHYETAFETS